MSIVERLTSNGKRFFEELGILTDEDIPKSFFDIIESCDDHFSEAEKFCLGDYTLAFCAKTLFSINDVVGTNHSRYANKTWIEAFLELEHGERILELYFEHPEYYSELKKRENCDIGLACKDGKYYILDSAGGGNNRMILMKIKYMALASKETCDLEKLNLEFSFMGNIRISPKEETARNIFYLMFPNGGFIPSDYQVLNRTTDIENPSFDIVTNYPINTRVLYKNIDEETLANLCTIENNELNEKSQQSRKVF